MLNPLPKDIAGSPAAGHPVMRDRRRAWLAGLLVAMNLTALPLSARACFIFEPRISGIPVTDGVAILEPFTGGLNSPKPNLADLDADGDLDLLITQPDGGLTYYRNQGTPSAFQFRFVTDQYQGIDANTWATLADIDGDGDLDLFTDGNGSVVFHRNLGSPSAPNWQLETSNFQNITNAGFGNTPSFINIDGDGDLDYLEMEQNLGTARFYRNDGTAQVPNFVFVTNEFGCINTFQGLRSSAEPPLAEESPQHGISVISTANIDADSDVDIFIGDLTNPNLWFFRNDPLGNCAPPCTPATICFTEATRDYLPLATLGINQARFADLENGDGDLDLLVGVTNQSAVLNNLIYFRNVGTPQNANLQLVDLNLIKAIDIGRGSQPATGDLDADGDRDLFLGADDGTIATYWNVGTATAPNFVRGDTLTDASGATIDVGATAAPVWIDYEGDGDLDLFIGKQSPARIFYYRNEGTPQARSLVLRDSDFGSFADNSPDLRPDFNATPTLGNLDGDLDLDLLVGEFGITSNPRIFYVRNDGTTQNPIWVTVCNNTPSTCVFATQVFQGDTAPELHDLDGDGDLDLLVGERAGNVNFYRNNGTPQSFSFVLETKTFGLVQVGFESATELVDIDGDGDEDLFVGEQNGGLSYYRRQTPVGIAGPGAPALPAAGLEIAPNPVRSGSGATVILDIATAGIARAGIYTADGRLRRLLIDERFAPGRHRLAWDGRDAAGKPLSPGVFFVKLELHGRTASTKLAVIR